VPSSDGGATPALVLQTFLHASPGRRDALECFLVANWLVMDQRAIERGLFTHAVLHAVTGAGFQVGAATVDFVMEVGYHTPGGYADVEASFATIRAAHQTVLIDGLGLRELGQIVGEAALRPVTTGSGGRAR
jgi:hypothetical protein